MKTFCRHSIPKDDDDDDDDDDGMEGETKALVAARQKADVVQLDAFVMLGIVLSLAAVVAAAGRETK